MVERYIKCLKSEIVQYANENRIMHEHGLEPKFIIKTIYIGGGTPSSIDELYILNVMETIKANFEIDEKVIKVSQGEETAELPWNQVYKVTGNKKRILIFSNRRNAYILPEEQLGEEFSKVKEIATEVVEKYRLKIK